MTTRQFVSVDYKNKKIGDAKFTGEIIPCANGVIYLIDKVLTQPRMIYSSVCKKTVGSRFSQKRLRLADKESYSRICMVYTPLLLRLMKHLESYPKRYSILYFSLKMMKDWRISSKHHITGSVFAYGKSSGDRVSLGVANVTPFSAFGQQLNYKIEGDHATVDGAEITQTDIPCANGIIHVIDSVILPAEKSLLQLISDEKRFSTLTRLLEETGLDLPLASSRTQYTIFAPINEAWEKEPYKSIIKKRGSSRAEALYGILARHVIVGKHVSENPNPYNKLRTIHGAPIYLTTDNGETKISGIPIIDSDSEAFNGLVNAIGSVIHDPMELPESDITTIDAILFVQKSLKEGSDLYDVGEYESSWRSYNRNGYEFLSKYGQFLSSSQKSKLVSVIVDDQPVAQLANEAWKSRNVFKDTLRALEQREDRIVDSYLMQLPQESRFGR